MSKKQQNLSVSLIETTDSNVNDVFVNEKKIGQIIANDDQKTYAAKFGDRLIASKTPNVDEALEAVLSAYNLYR